MGCLLTGISAISTLLFIIFLVCAIAANKISDSTYFFYWAIGSFIVAAIASYIEQNISNSSIAKEQEKQQAKALNVKSQSDKILRDFGLPEDTTFFRFFLDSDFRQIAFLNRRIPYFFYIWENGYKKLPLKCIIETVSEAKYVTSKTAERKGTVKRALVGGALAGGVGAIIGGTTGDTVINEDVTLVDAWMRIQTNEVEYRTFIVHASSKEEADDHVAIVKAIISKYANSLPPASKLRRR